MREAYPGRPERHAELTLRTRPETPPAACSCLRPPPLCHPDRPGQHRSARQTPARRRAGLAPRSLRKNVATYRNGIRQRRPPNVICFPHAHRSMAYVAARRLLLRSSMRNRPPPARARAGVLGRLLLPFMRY